MVAGHLRGLLWKWVAGNSGSVICPLPASEAGRGCCVVQVGFWAMLVHLLRRLSVGGARQQGRCWQVFDWAGGVSSGV